MLAPTITRDEELHWIALTLAPGLGPVNALKLLSRFRTPISIFRASRSELEAAGLSGSLAQSVASGCSFEDAVLQQEKMLELGVNGTALGDPRYPECLRRIPDPPVFLFTRGRIELLGSPAVAVVGTRRPTAYGSTVAERFAHDLAAAGLTIISGMARGIDTCAHRGALDGGGNTIAVLGCGVDSVYPAENHKLSEEIAEKGLIVSEFPIGTPAYPQNFPIRNRIVSGLSAGVLVVEGAQYSGSAITAKLALEQSRDLYAVPGNVTGKMSWGPNLLIRQGASLVQTAEDVLTGLPKDVRQELARRSQTLAAAAGADGIGGTQEAGQASLPLGPSSLPARDLLGILQCDRPIHIDELLQRLDNYSSTELIAAVFELELIGLVKQLPGKNFLKVW